MLLASEDWTEPLAEYWEEVAPERLLRRLLLLAAEEAATEEGGAKKLALLNTACAVS